MNRELSLHAETLAKAAIVFCQKTHQAFPRSVVEPLDNHYSDEALTVAIQIPAGLDKQEVSDELIRIALAVEDTYGVTILTQAISTKPA